MGMPAYGNPSRSPQGRPRGPYRRGVENHRGHPKATHRGQYRRRAGIPSRRPAHLPLNEPAAISRENARRHGNADLRESIETTPRSPTGAIPPWGGKPSRHPKVTHRGQYRRRAGIPSRRPAHLPLNEPAAISRENACRHGNADLLIGTLGGAEFRLPVLLGLVPTKLLRAMGPNGPGRNHTRPGASRRLKAWFAAPNRAVFGSRTRCTGTSASSPAKRPFSAKAAMKPLAGKASISRGAMPPPR